MSQHSHQPRGGSRLRVGTAATATALLSILIFGTPALPVHATDAPTSGTTAAPKPASSPAPATAQRKSKDGKVKPFLGGSQEGTGIRKAAPVGPRANAASAQKPGDGSVKPFVGAATEGTGIRKAVPVGAKAAAAAAAKKDGS